VTEAERYDLAIIGAGPGGYVAAIRAAQLGMRVVCVDREAALGGTCLRIVCIPSKALLDSSELFWQARTRLAAHGVGVGEVSLDLAVMMRRKEQVVEGLTSGVAGLFKKSQITRRHGTARIAARDRVAIEGPDAGTVIASRILIATGSGPATLPGFELDGVRIVSSEERCRSTRSPRASW
jgi:dihydrolipoamide dehydrogenase